MTITYSIKNVTQELVQEIMLRKFFQMVFVGNDRKSLHIYTASVIGASTKCNSVSQSHFISDLEPIKSFYMEFGFSVKGNDNNDVVAIVNEDVTDGENNFLSQIEYIRQVWGDECEIIHNDQKKLNKRLKDYLGVEPTGNKQNIAQLAQHNVLWIEDKKKEQEGEMSSLAIAGAFNTKNYKNVSAKNKKDYRKLQEEKEAAYYLIKVPQEITFVKGFELVNWVKTTIQFKNKFRETNLNFCIQKEECETQYVTPDFTWYFSPPVKSFIDNESSSVEIKYSIISNSENGCKYSKIHLGKKCDCPVRNQMTEQLTKRYLNVINPVANKTTVYFKRWTEHEKISYRKKYRLATKNVLMNHHLFSDIREMNMFIDTTDEHSRGNRQYVLSIFISFALAFGIDSTRLKEVAAFFPFASLFNADALWLLLLIVFTMNLLIRPPHEEGKSQYFIWRKINIIVCLIWIIYVFIISKSPGLATLLPSLQEFKDNIIQGIYVLLIISMSWYTWLNVTKFHDPILSEIFDDDIL